MWAGDLLENFIEEQEKLNSLDAVKNTEILMRIIKTAWDSDTLSKEQRHEYLAQHLTFAHQLSEAYKADHKFLARDSNVARDYAEYAERLSSFQTFGKLDSKKASKFCCYWTCKDFYKYVSSFRWTSKDFYKWVYLFASFYALGHRVNLFILTLIKHEIGFFINHVPYIAFSIFVLELMFDLGIAFRKAYAKITTRAQDQSWCQVFTKAVSRKMSKPDRMHRLIYITFLALAGAIQLFVYSNPAMTLLTLSGVDLLHLSVIEWQDWSQADKMLLSFNESEILKTHLKQHVEKLKYNFAKSMFGFLGLFLGSMTFIGSMAFVPSEDDGKIAGSSIVLLVGFYACYKRALSACKQTKPLADIEIDLEKIECSSTATGAEVELQQYFPPTFT